MSDDNRSLADIVGEQIDRERAERKAALGFDLLPCPFCGGTPYVDYNDEFDEEYIACDCGACFAGADLAGWNSRIEAGSERGAH